jgi:branched-chain amino acid transport system substrate-binding protein
LASVLLGAALAASAGCSLVLDTSDECTRDEDCRAGLVCAKRLCVAPAAGTSDTSDAPDTSGAPDAADAADAGPSDTGPADVPTLTDAGQDAPALAEVTADAPDAVDAHSDAPSDVLTPDKLLVAPCDKLYGVPLQDALSDNTILIGALLPRTGLLNLLGVAADQAVEMAFNEINQAGGLFGRKFAVLSCDTGTDLAQAQAAAAHLVDVAKVPAIIGAISSGISIQVFNDHAHAAGVLMLSPAATAGLMTTLPDDGLVWRTAPSNALQGVSVAHYLLDQGVTKVAVINRSDVWGASMRSAMETVLCAAGGIDCGIDYIARAYDDSTIMQDISDALVAFATFQPEVVVVFSYFEDGLGFVNAASSQVGLKRFVFGDGNLRDPVAFEPQYGVDPEVLCRAFGVAFADPSGLIFQSFKVRFGATWSGAELRPYTPNAYDAAYVMAYAIAAVRQDDVPLTGALIAEGLKRLSAGEAIETGQGDWNRGIQILGSASDATIDYVGASGNVDLDPATGEVIGQAVEGWRLNGTLEDYEKLGVVYDPAGVYHSPDYTSVAADPVCDALIGTP